MTLLTQNSMMAQNVTDRTVYQFTMDDIEGNPVSLEKFKGKVLLIVNVASECGLTPQYEDLEMLYSVKKSEGFEILGFPANNFLGQEPGTNEEIASFCKSKFGVDFPMFSKIDVVGDKQHPLYQFLTQEEKNGVLSCDVTWNFQKFLISRSGEVICTFKPKQKVDSEEVLEAIRKALSEK